MNIESHLESLRESVKEVDDAVLAGLVAKQRTLGFHTSAAAVDILEIMLHKHKLIDLGFVIKHDWFNSSRKIKEKFSFDFPHKKTILEHISSIEGIRNQLCYGKRQPEEVLEKLVNDFNSLKKLFCEVTGYEL